MKTKKLCANCQGELNVGCDATRIEEGVIGVKDFVPLGKPLFFCRDQCVSDYFDLDGLPSLPRRMP
jgi:hypothetical protein